MKIIDITLYSIFVIFAFSISIASVYASSHMNMSGVVDTHVPENPMRLALTDNFIYVPSFSSPYVSVIDKNTHQITDSIYLGYASQAMDVLPIPEKNNLYVPITDKAEIKVYDLTTNNLTETIILPNYELVLESTSGQQYSERSDTVFETGGWSLDYDPNTMLLYMADYNSHKIGIIDLTTHEVMRTIDVARHPYSVKVDPNANTIVVTSLAGNAITFIESKVGSDGQVSHDIGRVIQSETGPWGLDVDSENNKAYVTNRGGNVVTSFDTKNHELIGEIPLESRGQAITVDPETSQVYVGYYQVGKTTILKIDGKTGQIISTFDPGAVAWDMEFDSESDILYLSLKEKNKVMAVDPTFFNNSNSNYGQLSLKDQLLSAASVNEIKCKENFSLVLKKSTGDPACIKPESVIKLVERGWAQIMN